MRDLEFIIDGQIMKKDPACSFSNIVAGSKNFFRCKFNFCREWNGFSCAAVFNAAGKVQYVPIIDCRCMIPDTITSEREYLISIIGTKDDTTITTNSVKVFQTKN